jgi:hypothetical protein
MPDIIITPSSGLIDFFPVSTRVGRIEGSGNTINVLNPSGYVSVSGSGMSVNTSSPNATFHAYSATSGATLLNLEGTNGSLFSVVDNLSGSLMSVNNNAGLPVFEVFSDDRVVAGRFGQNDFIMTSGGNIGIGTGVPSSKFHVVGSVLFSSGLSVTGLITSNSGIITGSGSASSPSHSFIGNTNAGFYNPATNAISLATSGVDRLYVDSLGNVGINTTVPQNGFKLDVNGAAVIRGSILTNSTIQEFGNSRYQLHSGAASNSVSYVCNGGGRFGVGFTAPSGLVAISGGVSIGSNYNLTPPTNGLIIEGNVGIGTTTPTSQLHVVGSGLFTSGLAVTGLITSNSGNFINSLQLNGSGVGLYDTSVFNLGTISGTNAINCGQDRQIQTLTLNGVATTFTTGTGWPTSSSVARETTLNIFASGNTSVTWTIVNDWYRQPDSPLPSGRHIVLLRSVGSGNMQGHYIGNKTN